MRAKGRTWERRPRWRLAPCEADPLGLRICAKVHCLCDLKFPSLLILTCEMGIPSQEQMRTCIWGSLQPQEIATNCGSVGKKKVSEEEGICNFTQQGGFSWKAINPYHPARGSQLCPPCLGLSSMTLHVNTSLAPPGCKAQDGRGQLSSVLGQWAGQGTIALLLTDLAKMPTGVGCEAACPDKAKSTGEVGQNLMSRMAVERPSWWVGPIP